MNMNEYECESCGGVYTIMPDTTELVEYCPGCGENNNNIFKTTNVDEKLFFDDD